MATLRAARERCSHGRRCLVHDCGPLLPRSDGRVKQCHKTLGCEPKAHGVAEARPRREEEEERVQVQPKDREGALLARDRVDSRTENSAANKREGSG